MYAICQFCSNWFTITITSQLFQFSCKKSKVLLQLFLTKCPFKNQLKASQNHWYGTARTGPGVHYIDVSLCMWKMNTLSLRWVWLTEGCVWVVERFGEKGGGSLQRVAVGENYLITASVPCHSFHLDQFNNLTDTNFFTVSVAQPIWEWRIKQSLVVSLDSLVQGWGWNTGGKRSLADLSAHQAGLAGWTTWNILFWFVNRAGREWDPLGEYLWDHVMPWLCVAFIHKVSASPFLL